MRVSKFWLFLFVLPLLSFASHKYYLSLTDINYRSKSKSVQIIINVFMDDIELALNKDYDIDLQLTTKNELKNNDIYFQKYLNKKIHFKINNNPKTFTYVGKEYDGDLVYFYLEIQNIESVKNLEIKNTILMHHFPDQQNLIKLKVGKKNKSILLTTKTDKGLLKF